MKDLMQKMLQIAILAILGDRQNENIQIWSAYLKLKHRQIYDN
jgi:hypothetical protein